MDAIAEWTDAYHRVVELMSGISPEQAAMRVPATPDWTMRELLAHMIGLDADILAGNEPGDHGDAWTQNQVDKRADAAIPDLLAEWATLVLPLQEWMRANNTRPLGDVTIHEQDLRGALGVPGGRDTDALRAIRDRMADGFTTKLDGASVALVSDTWTLGSPDADVVLTASEYELARALMTRRSANQLRSWVTRGDVEPHLDAFAILGPLPANDLIE